MTSTPTPTTVGCVPPAGYSPIRTESEFRNMSNRNGNYFLCNNIHLSTALSPLFNNESFRGTLDGGNRTLSGVSLIAPSLPSYGLVRVLEGGVIRNLTITNPQVHGKGAVGVVAGLSAGTIQNVTIVGGQVTADRHPAGVFVGIQINGSLQNCSSSTFVTAQGQTGDQSIGVSFP